MKVSGIIMAVVFIMSPVVYGAEPFTQVGQMPPAGVEALPETVPSSSLSNMIFSTDIADENKVDIWEAGYIFHPKYQGFIFSSIEIPSQQYDTASYNYLEELCKNLNGSEIVINGISHIIDNAEVVSLFNLGYFNQNFYKGVYIPVGDGIFIFPNLHQENKLMIGFSDSALKKDDVAETLAGGIQVIADTVMASLPEKCLLPDDKESLDKAVGRYYDHAKLAWDEKTGITHDDMLAGLKILQVLAGRESDKEEQLLQIEEIASATFNPIVHASFTRYHSSKVCVIKFNKSLNFSNLKGINFEFSVPYAIAQKLDTLRISIQDVDGNTAGITLEKKDLLMEQVKEGISALTARIVLEKSEAKMSELNKNEDLTPVQRLEAVTKYLLSLDFAGIAQKEYNGQIQEGDEIKPTEAEIGSVIGINADSGELYFKISQKDIDNIQFKVTLLQPLSFDTFQQDPNFNASSVQNVSMRFTVSRGTKAGGDIEIKKIQFSIQPDSSRDIRLYQYKDAVLEPFMRFYADFNPLTDAQDDKLLTDIVMPVIEGKETFLEMKARVFWHMENVIFLSKYLGALQNNVEYDSRRVEAFEQLLENEGGNWEVNIHNHDEVENLRNKVWRQYGEKIRKL